MNGSNLLTNIQSILQICKIRVSRTDEEIATAIADIESTPILGELFERIRNGLLSGEIKGTEQEERELTNVLQRIAQGNVAKDMLLPIFKAEQQKRAEQQAESKTEPQPKAKAKPKATPKATPKTTAKAKTPKRKKEVNFFKYILPKKERELRPVLAGVFMRDGYRVASDTHILIAERAEYPPALEGRVINEDGIALVDMKGNPIINNLSWQRVIPTPENSSLVLTPIESIMAMLEQAKPLNKIFADDAPYNGNTATEIEIETENGPAFFDSAKLALFMDFVLTIDNPTLAYGNKTRSIWVTSADGSKKAVLMGLASESDRVEAIRISTRKGIEVGADFSYNNKKTNELKSELKESEDYIALMKAQPVPPRRELSFHEKKVAQLKALIAIREGKTEFQQTADEIVADTPDAQLATEAAIMALTDSGIDVVEATDEMAMAVMNYEGVEMNAKSLLNSLERASRTIKNWISRNTRGKSFEIHLPKATRDMIRRVMGRDFDSHNITANGIAHALINHGENGKKLSANSIPITKENAELIPYIMVAPDRVGKGSTDITNRESIKFYKQLSNGYVIVIEKEYKNSPHDMETITMWAEMSSSATDAQQEVAPDINALNAIQSTDIAKIRKDAEDAILNDQKNHEFQIVFHGSGAKFDAFDHSHMGEGEGNQSYGWGTYVTESEGIGRAYASTTIQHQGLMHELTRLKERLPFLKGQVREEAIAEIARLEEQTNGGNAHYLYSVEIPNDNGHNYLRHDKPVSSREISRIKQRLFETLSQGDYKGAERELREELNGVFTPGLEGDVVYNNISAYLGGGKQASLFLNEMGYVGIKYPSNYMSGGNTQGQSNYVIFNEADAKIVNRVEFLRTPQGTIYGWTDGKRIYLTRDGMNPETPVHEYTHLWARAMMQNNAEGWQSIKDLLRDTPVWREVVNDDNYANIRGDEDAIASEVLSRLSGKNGAQKMTDMAQQLINEGNPQAQTLIGRIRQALQDFWRWVGVNLFDIKEFESIEQITDRVLWDMVQGTELGNLATSQNKLMISSQNGELFRPEDEITMNNVAANLYIESGIYIKELNKLPHLFGSHDGKLNAAQATIENAKKRIEILDEYKTMIVEDMMPNATNPAQEYLQKQVDRINETIDFLNEVIANPEEASHNPKRFANRFLFRPEEDAADTFTSAAEAIAQQLGVEIEIDESIPAKGSYNPRTGRIRINPSRHATAEDVQRTVLHETIGHGGIQAVAGKRFGQVCQQVYDMMSEEQRADIRSRHGNLSDEAVGAEYMAEMAEKGKVDITTWEKVKAMVRNMLMSM